jgi:serine/threonine protein kinase
MQSSTLRSAIDQTVTPSNAAALPIAHLDPVVSQGIQSGQTDLVDVLHEHPSLLRNRSLLMEMVFHEYTARRRSIRELDLENHCRRFEQFGNSIRRSIQRELEVLRFLDVHGEPPDWPKAGEEMDRFRVLEELGFGGSARVYLCQDDEIGNRLVIVKATPLPSFEASILGKLNHENIIPIYSTGFIEERELNYLCMPYRGRSTLADLVDTAFQDGCPRNDSAIGIAANRWTSGENLLAKTDRRGRLARSGFGTYVGGVLKLAKQIADALKYAHGENIVHGDLKPSNVLLTPDGKPLLLDFNLSQDFTSDSCLRGGTLPYMPPEHLQAVARKTAALDTTKSEVSADVYSYGALLYELLTGVAPYHDLGPAEDPSTMAVLLLEKIEKGAPSIRQYNRFVGARLESLVLRCLSYDKSKRPVTMAEVKEALQKERRPWAAAFRHARIRPVVFSIAAFVSFAIISGAAAYVALQPPRYLSNYDEGMRLASIGEFDKAASYFTSAARNNPSFSPARFQLGRAWVAKGEFDLAIDAFRQLAQDGKDSQSMEWIGYCFNLKRVSVAAIPWYEMAVQKGDHSTQLYNNLGASYLEASAPLSVKDRLDRAELYLLKALESAPSSPVIRLNVVRHARARSMVDPTYDVFAAWPHAQYVLARCPGDPFIEGQIALWYEAIRNRDLEKSKSPDKSHLSAAELTARKQFAALFARVRSRNQNGNQAFTVPSKQVSFSDRRFFLEPIALR